MTGADAGSGMMWSRVPSTDRNGSVMSVRRTRSPPRTSRPVIIALSRTSICTVCLAAAPGNGTWSVSHPVMAR